MIIVKIKTALALGLVNLLRVFLYKIGVKTGISPVKRIVADITSGELFNPYEGKIVEYEANQQWVHSHTYFGCTRADKTIPQWSKSCLTGQFSATDKPWYLISDFDNALGDIKGVWEASRFDWVLGFAQQVKLGNNQALVTLNAWLEDWLKNNPPYQGVNWKCGQEASIRIMHLATAAMLLEQTSNTSKPLLDIIKAHLMRISPTIMYAVAQDNNHGTSEAAALYIGGSWLQMNGCEEGHRWQQQGKKWLENRAKRLIEKDGSFSQYSVTYHRVMLDTYSLVEAWRLKHQLTAFSTKLYAKLQLASDWLYYFTNISNGDAPNLGANDGARLIPLSGTDYRDFRPSVQLASILFTGKLAYHGDGSYNLPLQWLEIEAPVNRIKKKVSKDFPYGGYAYLSNDNAEVYVNYPRFHFRPSQCDSLHIDLWLNNQNIFRDGGTFSYNAGAKYINYYGGSQSHCSVQFDDHEQMPRISRFLLGSWLKLLFKQPLKVLSDEHNIAVGYKDRFGCEHKRFISLSPSSLFIKDSVKKFQDKALLRFRLAPSNWKLFNNTLTSDICTIVFSADVAFKRIELTTGYESRYYYQESTIPVLEIEVCEAGTITTEVKL